MSVDGSPTWDQFGLLIRARRLVEARELAMRAIRLAPDDANGYAMMSTVTRLSGELAESRRFAQQAIQHAPDWSFPYYSLAWAIVADEKYRPLNERGRPIGNPPEARLREAHRLAQVALKIAPEDPANYHLLSFCLNFQEKRVEALAAAESGLRYDPSQSGCRNEQLRALFALGRFDDVEARAKEALADDPESDDFHHWLAATYSHTGRHELALPHAREAVRLDPTDTDYQATFLQSLAAQPRLSRWLIRVLYVARSYMRLIVLPPRCWAYWLAGLMILFLAVLSGGRFPDNWVSGLFAMIAVWWLILLPLLGIFLVNITESTIDLLLATRRDTRRYLSRWETAAKIALPVYYVLMVVAIAIMVHVDKQAGRSEMSGLPISAVWASVVGVWACSTLHTVRAKAVGYLTGSTQLASITIAGLIALALNSPTPTLVAGIASLAVTAVVCTACVFIRSRRPNP